MKVLGLDLGSASIGWALIEINDDSTPQRICGMGSRIIPYASDTIAADFKSGKGETACSTRTRYRQMRRQLDRWQLHREQLVKYLVEHGIMTNNEEFPPLNPEQIWGLRAKAAKGEKLTLPELARVLLHINHRRGYKHAKSDMGGGKETEYVGRVNDRYKTILDLGVTVGEYFYQNLIASAVTTPKGKTVYTYRIKEQVFPRKAYEEETAKILSAQAPHYPDILTEDVISNIHRIIFYQRPLKSCKHLVSHCDFERRIFRNKNGKEVDGGPKVTPRTSPLAQVCRIYEAINNITLENPRIDKKAKAYAPSLFDDFDSLPKDARKLHRIYEITDEERQKIFNYLNTHEKLSLSELFKILNLKKSDGYLGDKLISAGIKGNDTYVKISKALEPLPDIEREKLLRFNLQTEEWVNEETGEITSRISPDCQLEPLFMLWHTLYSIDDQDELFNVLRNKFGIDNEDALANLFAIDFVKAGYSNKSAKFIRRILPYLMQGMKYSDAAEAVGVNHSNSITKEQNQQRELQGVIPTVKNGSLRQPIVEKVINQTVNLVNAIKDRYGEIDEIRVEMARELQQCQKDRANATSAISKQERENAAFGKDIEELGITPSKRRIQKMRMLAETGNKCIYCNAPITPTQFIEGHGYDIEHIIPRSRLFNDSFANKVCACRKCNAEKGNKTGYEFMKSKSESEFNSYKERVHDLWIHNKISKSKRNFLLMDGGDIPSDFINRDLNETSYIARKVMEILRIGIRNVGGSSGRVTDFLRHTWGYDNILHDLNFAKHEEAGLTEEVEYETHGQMHKALRIKDWTKRKDHRHHAVDALVIALTRQKYIHNLNTLNASSDEGLFGIGRRNLEKQACDWAHFDYGYVKQKVDEISVSFKGGKKLATPGKRQTDRNGKESRTLVPRAPLHKETVYGEIRVQDGKKPLKYAFQNLDLIVRPEVREALTTRLNEHNGDVAKTLKDVKKNPILINNKEVALVNCFRKEIVVKYPIGSIKKKDIPSIVDGNIRRVVKERFDSLASEKDFEKSLADNPLFADKNQTLKINTVRCFTGLRPQSLATVAKNSEGKGIGFTQTQNNHHMAIYQNEDGKLEGIVASFWECIKRKRYGIPIIIENPSDAWDTLLNLEENEDVEEIAKGLPTPSSKFLFSLQRNEMVVLGMSDDEWNDAVANNDIASINRYLYRVWKLSENDFNFKFHTNTMASIDNGDKEMKSFYRFQSLKAIVDSKPRKIRVTPLGELLLPTRE